MDASQNNPDENQLHAGIKEQALVEAVTTSGFPLQGLVRPAFPLVPLKLEILHMYSVRTSFWDVKSFLGRTSKVTGLADQRSKR